jgi:hypothetical protein
MEEYKGIYYGDSSEQKFYEGGAHFKYIELFKILDFLEKKQKISFSISKSPEQVIIYLILYYFRTKVSIKQEM